MDKYDYRQAVRDDILDYIKQNDIKVTDNNREEVEGFLYDTLFVEDSVTGNASGSFTFNRWKAEEYLCHNLDLLADAGTYSSVLDELEVEEEDECRMDGDEYRLSHEP